jgi:outer membrane protein OmpA-like peptidoglycan-associated protein
MKIKLIVGIFLFGIVSTEAQELSIKINGGLSGIQYDSAIGNGSIKFGAGLGLGYTYSLSNHWGVLAGIETQYNSNEFKLNPNQKISSYEIDDVGSAFDYRVSPKGYKETQHFMSFAIPVMVQYRTQVSNSTGIYLGLGGKFLIPSKLKAKVSTEELALSGYYPDLNLEIYDLPSHGFGTLNNRKDEANISLKTSVLLSMEGGFTFKLKKGMQLYAGIYADYGLSDLQKKDNANKNLIQYSPEGIDMAKSNGVLMTSNIVDGSNYLAAGIQVKLGFSIGKIKVPKEASVMEEKTMVEEQKPISAVVEPQPLVKENPKRELSKEELTFVEEPIVFGSIDQTIVTPELAKRLDVITETVNKDENVVLLITGYTCDLGTTVVNKRIGMERANSIANYLKEQGVSESRMELFSKGEKEPLVPNTSIGNRQKNRRVSIQIKEK